MRKYIKTFKSHTQYETFINGGGNTPFVRPNVSYCTEENEVHYNPFDPYNGHEYVDLGLPSGTKWAKMNVGANSPTDYGLYFAWGETTGYTASQLGNSEGQKVFNWTDYALTEYGDETVTKYNETDGKTVLDLEDDAAHVNWGGDWHMPNGAQCFELFNETKNGFVTDAGVFTQFAWNDIFTYLRPTDTIATISGWNTAGYLFFKSDVSDMDAAITNGDYLFIPAAGACANDEVLNVGNYCCVWASDLNPEDVTKAWCFYYGDSEASVSSTAAIRVYGSSVRGVVGQMDEITV